MKRLAEVVQEALVEIDEINANRAEHGDPPYMSGRASLIADRVEKELRTSIAEAVMNFLFPQPPP